MDIKNKTLCITGNLKYFNSKKEAWDEITSRGGNTVKDLKMSCDYLILGAKGSKDYIYGNKGNKQVTAERWIKEGQSIKIITENQFLVMLEENIEVPEEEKGQLINPAKWPPITIENIVEGENVINYSVCIHPPRQEIIQILRVTFNGICPNAEKAKKLKESHQKLRNEIRRSGFKNSITTEILPLGIWGIIKKGQSISKECLLFSKIILILNTDQSKEQGKHILKQLKEKYLNAGLSGELSMRIWDETYKHGKYWIDKIK